MSNSESGSAGRIEALTEEWARLGVHILEASLFHVLHFGLHLPPEDLADRATWPDYRLGGAARVEDSLAALKDCLGRGWLQVIDEQALSRIRAELRAEGRIGPIYGLPEVGDVDFTPEGAALWRSDGQNRTRAAFLLPFAYSVTCWREDFLYFRNRSCAAAALKEHQEFEEVVSATGPTEVGPWRAQWWRRFDAGYRIRIESRSPEYASIGVPGADCHLDQSVTSSERQGLAPILARHGLSLCEWLMLRAMEQTWSQSSTSALCRGVRSLGEQIFETTFTNDDLHAAWNACRRQGWLTVIGEPELQAILAYLHDVPALHAVPTLTELWSDELRYADGPGGRLEPLAAGRRMGQIDFTPAGAEFYRAVSGEWLGADWEDRLNVTQTQEYEKDYYGLDSEGFAGLTEEHVAKGEIVLQRRIVPIGPWCLYWWKPFPAGHRLELRLRPR